MSSASLYWGSVDAYNFVDLLGPGGVLVRSIAGTELPSSNGDQTAVSTNRRVFFTFTPDQPVTALRLRSTGTAFEFDNIAAANAVPEPASWAMLIVGFGLVGAGMRRPHRKSVTA